MSAAVTHDRPAVQAGWATDVGARPHNEDAAVVTDRVYVVADGMGGHAAGEVAADLAASSLGKLSSRPEITPADVLSRLTEANAAIAEAARTNPAQRTMRTTVAGLVLVSAGGSPHWMVFNVGDSRVYRYVGGALLQVTVDHSEVRELIDAGVIDESEAARHPGRNVVTRSLGETQMGAPDVWVFPPESGEIFLICSDGLSGVVPHEEIEAELRSCAEVQQSADRLVRRAVGLGGRDNVTAIVVRRDPSDLSTAAQDTTPRLGASRG